ASHRRAPHVMRQPCASRLTGTARAGRAFVRESSGGRTTASLTGTARAGRAFVRESSGGRTTASLTAGAREPSEAGRNGREASAERDAAPEAARRTSAVRWSADAALWIETARRRAELGPMREVGSPTYTVNRACAKSRSPAILVGWGGRA